MGLFTRKSKWDRSWTLRRRPSLAPDLDGLTK